jgi:hypothetical protein
MKNGPAARVMLWRLGRMVAGYGKPVVSFGHG